MIRGIRAVFLVATGLLALAVVILLIMRGSTGEEPAPLLEGGPFIGDVAPVGPGQELPGGSQPGSTELIDVEQLSLPERSEQQAGQWAIVGRVIRAGDGSAVGGGQVLMLEKPPAFVNVPIYGATELKGSAVANGPCLAKAPIRSDGSFRLVTPMVPGFFEVQQSGVVLRDLVRIGPGLAERESTLVVEAAGRVRGTVVDQEGTPLAGVTVSLRQETDPMKMIRRGSRVRPARAGTDEQGEFDFWSVPADMQMSLQAEKDDAPTVWKQVMVAAGESLDVRLEIDPGHAIAGRVISSRGEVIAGAKVEARHSAISLSAARSGNVDDRRVRGETGDDGRFELLGLGPALFDLRVKAEGFAEGSRTDIQVVAGGVELNEDIVLTEGLVISGVVLDDQDAPVPNPTLGFLKPSSFMGFGIGQLIPPGEVDEMGGFVCKGDELGRFRSPPLMPGAYDVSAAAEGMSIGSLAGVQAGTSGHELVLERQGSIQGIVLSRADGEPVPEYAIAAAHPFAVLDLKSHIPGPVEQINREDGTFSIDGLGAGKWNLRVAADKFAVEEIEGLEVKIGEVSRGVIILLDPPGVIQGLVLDRSSGTPVAGAQVSTRSGIDLLRAGPLQAVSDTQTDQEGRFEIGSLKPGKYKLSVTAEEYAPGASQRILVSEGMVVDGVTIYLESGAIIRGRVAHADGAPEVGVLVHAVAVGTMGQTMDTTDTNGRYELRGLAGGNYTVTKIGGSVKLGSSDMLSSILEGLATKTVRVKPGEVTEVDFLAGEGGSVTLSGRVTEAGEPLVGAILVVTPIDVGDAQLTGGMKMGTTGDHGDYRIDGIFPGEWTMTIQSGMSLGEISKESFDFNVPNLAEYQRDFDLVLTGFRGRVVSEALAKPLANIRVAVTALDEGASVDAFSRAAGSKRAADVFTDEQGFYRVQGLRVGQYQAVAGGTGMFGIGGSVFCNSDPVLVSVAAGELKEDVNFRLKPGGSLSGQVSSSQGQMIAGATVFLVGSNAEVAKHFGEIVSDETGSFRATGIEAQVYTVVVKADQFAPSVNPGVRVRASEDTEVDVTLKTGGSLTVSVMGADPALLGEATVRLFDSSGTELSAFVTLGEAMGQVLSGGVAAGQYELGALEPGVYSAEIVYAGTLKRVEVRHGSGDQVVEVELP